MGLKLLRLHQFKPLCARCLHQGLSQGVFRGLFGRGHPAQNILIIITGGKIDQIGELRSTMGQRAGLIKDHGLNGLGLFQGLTVLDQHPQLGPTAGSDHDRGGSCQAHGAGTGNDQHGNKKAQRSRKFHRSAQIPDQSGEHRKHHHHRDKVEAYPIGHSGYGGLGALSTLNHADDAGEHSVASRLFHTNMEDAILVQSAAHHPRALLFGNRQTLAGKHGFIDHALPLDDQPVHWNTVTGPDQQQIAGLNLIGQDFFLPLLREQHGMIRSQLHEFGNGIRGVRLGPRLHVLAQRDQGNQDSTRFIIKIHGLHLRIDSQHDLDQVPGGINKGGAGAHCD